MTVPNPLSQSVQLKSKKLSHYQQTTKASLSASKNLGRYVQADTPHAPQYAQTPYLTYSGETSSSSSDETESYDSSIDLDFDVSAIAPGVCLLASSSSPFEENWNTKFQILLDDYWRITSEGCVAFFFQPLTTVGRANIDNTDLFGIMNQLYNHAFDFKSTSENFGKYVLYQSFF
jgi:hypothetical protein